MMHPSPPGRAPSGQITVRTLVIARVGGFAPTSMIFLAGISLSAVSAPFTLALTDAETFSPTFRPEKVTDGESALTCFSEPLLNRTV